MPPKKKGGKDKKKKKEEAAVEQSGEFILIPCHLWHFWDTFEMFCLPSCCLSAACFHVFNSVAFMIIYLFVDCL
jgi:hypothetical protein